MATKKKVNSDAFEAYGYADVYGTIETIYKQRSVAIAAALHHCETDEETVEIYGLTKIGAITASEPKYVFREENDDES